MQSEKTYLIQKIKIMHTIALILLFLLSGILIYEIIQLNYLLVKKLITGESYISLVKDIIKDIFGLVTIIIVYFFGKETGKVEANAGK